MTDSTRPKVTAETWPSLDGHHAGPRFEGDTGPRQGAWVGAAGPSEGRAR